MHASAKIVWWIFRNKNKYFLFDISHLFDSIFSSHRFPFCFVSYDKWFSDSFSYHLNSHYLTFVNCMIQIVARCRLFSSISLFPMWHNRQLNWTEKISYFTNDYCSTGISLRPFFFFFCRRFFFFFWLRSNLSFHQFIPLSWIIAIYLQIRMNKLRKIPPSRAEIDFRVFEAKNALHSRWLCWRPVRPTISQSALFRVPVN